jgi:ABC-2 type transport system ATP-binding protein
VRALDGVDLDIQRGEVLTLLGPNGSGKTTLIKVLCDLVRADAGSVEIGGISFPLRAREALRHVGLVTTDERSFFWRLTGLQNLLFYAALHELPRRIARRRCPELMERFGLSPSEDPRFFSYSSGMKKRLALARALIHDPTLLLMDEATTSLDAEADERLQAWLRTEVRSANRAVLWATHRSEEIGRLSDRVGLLIRGRMRFLGNLAEFEALRQRIGTPMPSLASLFQFVEADAK